MSSAPLADQHDREQALDSARSFIVQAPAGSGKTELLTLRYLKLLCISEQPEEVLAITFTKKAASEMRDRIINSIRWAQQVSESEQPLDSELEDKRFEIASAVIQRDKEANWHLLQNPSRLRVQTIDSFCFYLARQMPVLSRIGGNARISEDMENCFGEAIAATLSELESETPLSDDIAALLSHLDNDFNRVERLLIGLLYNRDQWLSYALDISASFDDARIYLQSSLDQLIEESLLEAYEALQGHESELIGLVNYSALNLANENKLSVENFEALQALPEPDYQALPYWHFLVEMLLTKDDGWRKALNKNIGFPAGDKQDKELCQDKKRQLTALLEQFRTDDDLLESLAYLRLLPNPAFEQQQWDFLAALTRTLIHLGGQLLLAFRKYRVIDYTQTGAAARTALGSADNPTDLALSLDHRIQHILVDEFQDTSQLQLEILQQLTSGWQQDDGRSLFLVGDAMQSCYGFRNANVGIYLNVQQKGLGDITLQRLVLQTNFRSQGKVVDWVNLMFSSAFPRLPNSSRGAVPYTAAVAIHPAIDEHGVSTELICYEQGQRQAARLLEAERIVETIFDIRSRQPEASIAVLVRGRSHLSFLIPCLREADIHWQATDIDRMESLPVIEDLLSLTQAILNQADRLAWLSVLRSPWLGLNIADLFAIETFAGDNTIWTALQQLAEIDGLSADARQRLQPCIEIIAVTMQLRYRQGLSQLIELCWTLLRGSATTSTSTEQDSAAHFFDLLQQHEVSGGLNNLAEFRSKVSESFLPARTSPASANSIHLLTMHKSKGLEFDHVILPGLATTSRSDNKPLLQWHQRLNRQGQPRLFLAALSRSGSDEDMLYKLLRHEQQHKNALENTRLLYIAITRARTSVHMFATAQRNSKREVIPPNNSLLSHLWRELNQHPGKLVLLDLESARPGQTATTADFATYPAATPIRRLQQALGLSSGESEFLRSHLDACQAQAEIEPQQLPATDDHLARSIGTLIHRSLEVLVKAADPDAMANIDKLRAYWQLQLRQLRPLQDQQQALQQSLEFIESSVLNSVSHADYGWIFDANLEDSQCELRLTAGSTEAAGETRDFVVDRTFIDQQGVRWIIDYKTGVPDSEQDIESFIDSQRRLYSGQLQSYQKLFAQMEDRPSRTALFFTSIPTLVELN